MRMSRRSLRAGKVLLSDDTCPWCAVTPVCPPDSHPFAHPDDYLFVRILMTTCVTPVCPPVCPPVSPHPPVCPPVCLSDDYFCASSSSVVTTTDFHPSQVVGENFHPSRDHRAVETERQSSHSGAALPRAIFTHLGKTKVNAAGILGRLVGFPYQTRPQKLSLLRTHTGQQK